MLKNRKRKEVSLDESTILLLQIQAKREGRKLKNYMEYILKEQANSLELSDEYKTMMDDILDKKTNGKLDFISESDFREQVNS